MGAMDFDRSGEYRKRAHELIPGGAHTYAKGDDQYPLDSPGFIARGSGAHVWDVDGNEFIEYGGGLRSVVLGHGHPRVVDAVVQAAMDGTNFVRPGPLEVDMAERLLDLLPAADMVKFAKNGSDVTTAAVKLARAFTGRDLVVLCADQPFFSIDDWFIGTTPLDAGIPAAVSSLSLRFRYNNLADLERVLSAHEGQVACVVMEAATAVEPAEGFLPAAVELCHAHGALFVLDEMITGFRWHVGGAQATYGIEPDLSTFGKAIANGFALSALVGRREIMELGGLHTDRARVFLLSTTHGAETTGLAAGLATLGVYEDEDVIGHLRWAGDALRNSVAAAAAEAGVAEHFQVLGHPANLIYTTRDANGRPSQAFRTLFLQETIRRGVLAPSFVVGYAHGQEEIDRTIEAVTGALEIYRRALDDGIDAHLVGRSVRPVFRRHS
jgi:glutamate-1-semialdehyde 2,1-aminomutase